MCVWRIKFGFTSIIFSPNGAECVLLSRSRSNLVQKAANVFYQANSERRALWNGREKQVAECS